MNLYGYERNFYDIKKIAENRLFAFFLVYYFLTLLLFMVSFIVRMLF